MNETKYFACGRPPLNHCNGNIIRMNGIWLPNLYYNSEKSCMLLLKSVRLWSIECDNEGRTSDGQRSDTRN
jgi:hypothetical protein